MFILCYSNFILIVIEVLGVDSLYLDCNLSIYLLTHLMLSLEEKILREKDVKEKVIELNCCTFLSLVSADRILKENE